MVCRCTRVCRLAREWNGEEAEKGKSHVWVLYGTCEFARRNTHIAIVVIAVAIVLSTVIENTGRSDRGLHAGNRHGENREEHASWREIRSLRKLQTCVRRFRVYSHAIHT